MPFGPASRLGISLFDETPPVEWVPGCSQEEAETLIRAVYRQVLGNAHVMDGERLTVAVSQLKRGELKCARLCAAISQVGVIPFPLL
jgi:phycoerythrin-associated linker protein